MALDDEELEGRVAIIGMSGRFPGAPDVTTFWSNLRRGVESIVSFSEDELLAAGESLDNIRDPSYVPAAAPLDDIDQFDAGFFGMSPRDAAVFDPQHRLFLEVAWECFEHAGYVGERIDGSVGVFASCGLSEYMFKNVLANEHIAASVGEWLVRHTGNDTNFLATRVSYELDLHGPSLNVQTACSSTLVAVHLACQSLLSGECDVALAGGAVVAPVQRRGYFYKEGEILSPDGHCRAFDARSAGTVISSACGAVLLKPLANALDDGDHVLAVVRGSAINNDGRAKVGYLAPSVPGQAQVVTEALAVAGIEPRDVTYVEAHGTGTLIGDPIEIAGLTNAYRLSTDDTQFCAIGSLKSNIGHTGEAAGVSALIKTVLSLQHREIPPSLHFTEPNPQADFPNSPFFVNAALRPWEPGPGGRRIAGITGLGAGGTNAHVLVEEAPATEPSTTSSRAQLLTVSARTADGARRAAADLAAHLRAEPDIELADVAYTRLVGRKPFAMRLAVVATTAAGAADALEAPGKAVDAHRHGGAPSVVFMMPGGGAQYPGMGRQLYDAEPVYRTVIDDCAAALRRSGGVDLMAALFPAGEGDDSFRRLQAPSVALPALFATEVAMGRLLGSWGITPAAMIGHSAGEYAAACLAGVVTMEDGLALVALRGRLFETLPKGAMVSVSLPEHELRAMLPEGLSIAAVNAADLCVASGPEALVEQLEATLAGREIDATRIHIDVAAHSSMLEPILAEFGAFCRRTPFNPPAIPYVSNLTGNWITAADVTDPDYWVRHLRNAVRFREGIDTILTDSNRVLLEVGPGRTLTSLARMAPGAPAAVSPTLRHPNEAASDVAFALAALGRAWEAGVELDPAGLFAGEERHRVVLPTYPFDRQRYWVEPDAADTPRVSAKGVLRKRPLVDEWFSTPSWRRAIASTLADPPNGPVVVISDGSPLAAALASALASRRRVVPVVFGERFRRRSGGRFEVNPARADDWTVLVDALTAEGALPGTIVHMTALGPSRGRRHFGVGPDDDLVAYRETVECDHGSLLFLAGALSALSEPVRLALVTSGVHGLDSTDPLLPERALMHGACRVIPRELGHVETLAIDVDVPKAGSPAAVSLATAIGRELDAEWSTDVVVLRRGERWVRTFEPVELAPTLESPWAAGGVHLITGGFGGIGLSIAQHIAKSSASPTLVLIGRSALPPEATWDALLRSGELDATTRHRIEAVLQLRTLGAGVVVANADVTDEVAVAAVVADVRRLHGRIATVIHSAGILHDALIALRTPVATSAVVDVKAKGALVLGRVLAADPPDLFVLFSSVSSIIGLPGQVDYTAANAFLDAYAAKSNRDARTRALVVNWNAWQEVGMAVEAARVERDQAPVRGAETSGGPTQLFDAVDGDDDVTTFSTGFSRKRHWLLSEHVVRGGEALIPGTGYLELIRAAVGAERPVEVVDLFFLSPFVVGDGEVRTLKLKLDRASGGVTIFSDTETSPHVTATATPVELDPAPAHDIDAIRSRCALRVERFDGYSDQPFMAFGPRWGSLRSVEYGDGEALVTTVMPTEFAAELDQLWLHPALLDVATGSAQALIEGFEQATMFYVPFSYGRVLSRRPLPPTALCHVRLRSASANDLAVFDITITDPDGNEAVAIESFAMRRIAGSAALTSLRRTESPIAEPAGLESTVGSAMREGILPAEGVDAFDRIVGSGLAVQVVASSVDVARWMAKVDAEAGASDGEGAESGGPQYERPNISSDYVAPATAIERELATMWRELLGVERVGRDDDFFELGGQSLIAVRLFTRMKKRYSIDLPLSTLFEAPTIAQCAVIVATKLGVVDAIDTVDDVDGGAALAVPEVLPPPVALHEPGFRSLVTIQRGSDELIPFFCVHGSGGNVLNFRDLSQAMGRSQPFYGVQSRGIDGVSRPHQSIEEMAAAYLAEIRELQPDGPYLLGGYSGGGLVAYEMAHQLTAVGEVVALVVMFDTFPPQIPDRDVTVAIRLRRLRDERTGYLRQALTRRLDGRRDVALLAKVEAIAARGGTVPVELRDLHVQQSFVRAAEKYVLRSWPGHVVLMRAEQGGYEASLLGVTYGWDDLVDEFELVQVPGNHDTLVLEPNATTLVQQLRATLDRTQAMRHARSRRSA
jgi:acyl transferase domain-containing protein/thioesterase domain-containing protein